LEGSITPIAAQLEAARSPRTTPVATTAARLANGRAVRGQPDPLIQIGRELRAALVVRGHTRRRRAARRDRMRRGRDGAPRRGHGRGGLHGRGGAGRCGASTCSRPRVRRRCARRVRKRTPCSRGRPAAGRPLAAVQAPPVSHLTGRAHRTGA
jgi:hypothetical protein